MDSIGPRPLGIDIFARRIHLRLPLEIHNAVKIWTSKMHFWWSDLPVPSLELSIPTLELINQLSPSGDIGEWIPWAIVIIPLLNNLKSRASRKFGISTRAEPGEKISAGLIRVRDEDGE